ncbi:hypothetical protein FS749_006614 [Ceratobasidium sp. UAMH 11750]|nr:hypothetical protein FS749_006614 [Ceratobasidium sp. UAMH 11750]
MSPSERVFSVPELAYIICTFANQKDCGRLLRVNRSLFLCARTFAWRHVTGAIHLLRLMPATLSNQPSIQNHLVATINTSRLGIYAPFIESLEISRSPAKKYRIEGKWRISLAQAQSAPLLPNLRRLTYTGPRELDEDQLDYLALFLSPTIREIEITVRGYPLWQSLSSASRFLNQVSHKCPDLGRLRFYPGRITSEPDPDWDVELLAFTDSVFAIHEVMGRLGGLRSLTISPAVLQPDVFRVISTCPYLETLVVQSTSDGGPVYADYDLDDASFPALRHLELLCLDPNTIERLCSLEPLLRWLEHASVIYGDGCDEETWQFDRNRVESFYALVECCPSLTELKFDTGGAGHEIMMVLDLLDLFRSRALRYLDLTVFSVPTEWVGWAELLYALPLVEELHFPLDTIDYLELRHFATKLPQLRYLALCSIDFDGFNATRDPKRVPNPSLIPVRLNCGFHGVQPEGQYTTVARYLHALWPNIVVEADIIEGRADNSTRYNTMVVNPINHALSELRRASAEEAALVLP